MRAAHHLAGASIPPEAFHVVRVGHRFRSKFQSLVLRQFAHQDGRAECSPLPFWVRGIRCNGCQRIAEFLQIA